MENKITHRNEVLKNDQCSQLDMFCNEKMSSKLKLSPLLEIVDEYIRGCIEGTCSSLEKEFNTKGSIYLFSTG